MFAELQGELEDDAWSNPFIIENGNRRRQGAIVVVQDLIPVNPDPHEHGRRKMRFPTLGKLYQAAGKLPEIELSVRAYSNDPEARRLCSAICVWRVLSARR